MPRDNIILITTDQQRFDTIQAHGNRHIYTPHLNYMASEGIAFTRCYADCPICIPSRTTIMTGQRGFESGILGNMDHRSFMERETKKRRTLPALLTRHGYQTKAVGKMHFEPARANYGFEDIELPLDYMRQYNNEKQGLHPKAHGVGECEMTPVLSTVPSDESITSWTIERSIDFLETRDPLRPFFMWTSFTKPHPPFDPCADYWALYDTDKMPNPVYGDWSQDIEKTPQGFLAGSYENTDIHLYSNDQLKAIRRAYYAMITQVDYSLGRLFGCLRENNLSENTWIVFTSDHGEMLGDHHAAQKNLFFEGSAHVPLIIMPPKSRQSTRNVKINRLAQLADIYPSILEMAGIPLPVDSLGGQSLLHLNSERDFYGNCLNTHFCLMQDNIKLIYCRCGGHYLLFDLNRDPMEQHDLSFDAAWQHCLGKMKSALMQRIQKDSPQIFEGDNIITLPAPAFPGDINGRWLGFHHKDYTVDTFH